MKNDLDGLINRLPMAKKDQQTGHGQKRLSELEDRSIETSQTKRQKKKNLQSGKDL